MEYTLYLISYRPHLATEIEKSISPETFVYFDGTGYPSFSKLVNSVVAECPTEIVIIMSDKVRPTQNHVHELIAKLNQGYGFVGTYSYAFFGFRKDLMRRIGMFDERYVGGGYEDYDFCFRLREANIAMYLSYEVPYLKSQSSWDYSKSEPHHISKWGDVVKDRVIHRQMPEEKYEYDLGIGTTQNYLPWRQTYVRTSKKASWPYWAPFKG